MNGKEEGLWHGGELNDLSQMSSGKRLFRWKDMAVIATPTSSSRGFIFLIALFHSNSQYLLLFRYSSRVISSMKPFLPLPGRHDHSIWGSLATYSPNPVFKYSPQPSCIYMVPYNHMLCHFWDKITMRRHIFSTLALPI